MRRGGARPILRPALLGALAVGLGACALPRWPSPGPVTSPYGLRTLGHRIDMHHGVDLGLDVGTPVHAMSNGVVVLAGEKSGYGYAVEIEHAFGWTTLYGHLSAVEVRAGQRVSAGMRLGLSGNTGLSTGPHLHFELRRFGRSVDPAPLLGGLP